MTFPFDLSELTEAEKNVLILDQAMQLQGAFELIAELKLRIEALGKLLGQPRKTVRNSSTPPSQGRKATLTLNKTVTPLNDNYELALFARPTPIQDKAFNLLGVKPERTQ